MVDKAYYFFGEVYAVHGVAVAVLDMYAACRLTENCSAAEKMKRASFNPKKGVKHFHL